MDISGRVNLEVRPRKIKKTRILGSKHEPSVARAEGRPAEKKKRRAMSGCSLDFVGPKKTNPLAQAR